MKTTINTVTLGVIFLVTCLATSVQAKSVARDVIDGKSYAVFVASFNSRTNEIRGGVAGTAFFTSPTQAITAFHVLRAASFQLSPGFDSVQVWLVHEGESAIELSLKNLTFRDKQDLTIIQIDSEHAVSSKYVFKTALNPAKGPIHTEGFVANTGGPVLERSGELLKISAIPQLKRLRSEGSLIRKGTIDLSSQDVILKSADCMQLSYEPVVGLSGGPVIMDGQVIGMNSFADPGTRANTWAIDLSSFL